jgi:hypothetical protein
MNVNERTAAIESKVSAAIGIQVELTVRGGCCFTFSTDHVEPTLHEKIAAYFGPHATVKTEHDDECGSFAYVEIPGA